MRVLNCGIYIHIPFCKKRCIYCDFFSTTAGASERKAFLNAAGKELIIRKDEARAKTISTIYFGGGTPSLCTPEDINDLLHLIYENYLVSEQAEITLEANPDDITPDFAERLAATGVNRISLGVQTFNDTSLKFLKRRHNSAQAINAVQTLHDAGLTNISIDLIYGLPGMGVDEWKAGISTALSLPVTHLSAYALTYEPGTTLFRLKESGEVKETDDDTELRMFTVLIEQTAKAGFNHYEISNFARQGFESRHNSSYWNDTPYIGIGPGAHSYDGHNRRRNIPNLRNYIVGAGNSPYDIEHLTIDEKFNERVMTSLRTSLGLNLDDLSRDFGHEAVNDLLKEADVYIKLGQLQLINTHDNRVLKLTRDGIFVSNHIISELLRVE